MTSDAKIDTHNINADVEKQFVAIRVNPKIYKMHTIMNTAEELFDKAEFVIDGDPESVVIVKFIPRKPMTESELLGVAYKFNTMLVMHTTTR